MRPQYYSRKDICEMLSISKTQGLQIMHMFEHQGKAFRHGKLLRVSAQDFEKWIAENTGRNGKCVER